MKGCLYLETDIDGKYYFITTSKCKFDKHLNFWYIDIKYLNNFPIGERKLMTAGIKWIENQQLIGNISKNLLLLYS